MIPTNMILHLRLVKVMSEEIEKMETQRVFEFNLNGSTDEVNSILGEGYEITDIVPIKQTSGGSIYTRVKGHYVLRVLILFTPSKKKTRFDFKLVNMNREYQGKLNQLLGEEYNLGYAAIKIIPLDVVLDPEARAGIGKGTYGFGIFFIQDRGNELKVPNEESFID